MDGIAELAAAQEAARNGDGPPPLTDVEPRALADVEDVFRRWLHLPDLGAVVAVLGTVAANRLDQDPVWLLVVGPPSSGKTEIVMSVVRLPGVHQVATLTEAALLSGSPKKERSKGATGGVLRQIGEAGVLLHKDFGSVLSMHGDVRARTLAALREIYDGSWDRPLGVDGGRVLRWRGKIGLVAGCTGTVDRHHATMSALGDRFLLWRLPRIERDKQTRRGLRHGRRGAQMREELATAVAGLFAELPEVAPPELTEYDEDRFVMLADLATAARSAVERDGYSREIELIPEMEAPARLAKQLRCMLDGLHVIGADRRRAWQVVTKLALDSVPALRMTVMRALAGVGWLSTTDVENAVSYPNTTTRRTLEDLNAHGLVERDTEKTPYRWRLSDPIAEALAAIESFPEMSDGAPSAFPKSREGCEKPHGEAAFKSIPKELTDFSGKQQSLDGGAALGRLHDKETP